MMSKQTGLPYFFLLCVAFSASSTVYGINSCQTLFIQRPVATVNAALPPPSQELFAQDAGKLLTAIDVNSFPSLGKTKAQRPPEGKTPSAVKSDVHILLLGAQQILAGQKRNTEIIPFKDDDGKREVLALKPGPEAGASEPDLDRLARRLLERFSVRIAYDAYFFARYHSNAYSDKGIFGFPFEVLQVGRIPQAMPHEISHMYLDWLAQNLKPEEMGELLLAAEIDSVNQSVLPSSYKNHFRLDEMMSHLIDLISDNEQTFLQSSQASRISVQMSPLDEISRTFEQVMSEILKMPEREKVLELTTEPGVDFIFNKKFEAWPRRIRSFATIMLKTAAASLERLGTLDLKDMQWRYDPTEKAGERVYLRIGLAEGKQSRQMTFRLRKKDEGLKLELSVRLRGLTWSDPQDQASDLVFTMPLRNKSIVDSFATMAAKHDSQVDLASISNHEQMGLQALLRATSTLFRTYIALSSSTLSELNILDQAMSQKDLPLFFMQLRRLQSLFAKYYFPFIVSPQP